MILLGFWNFMEKKNYRKFIWWLIIEKFENNVKKHTILSLYFKLLFPQLALFYSTVNRFLCIENEINIFFFKKNWWNYFFPPEKLTRIEIKMVKITNSQRKVQMSNIILVQPLTLNKMIQVVSCHGERGIFPKWVDSQ